MPRSGNCCSSRIHMRRRLLSSALCLALLPCAAAAQQPSRDDAIRLMVAGDYQRAAEILRPLAEDSRQPDPSAQFLLAMLYESGHGVARSSMRACGLFLQAAAANGPFMAQATALGRRMKEEMGPMAEQMCAAGPWHDMPEATFTLGADHTVQYTSNSIVLRYQGAEKRIGTGNLPGVIPLPMVHTPLDVTQPVRERRHFIQSFFWVPDSPTAPASWSLYWGLAEIVGAEFVGGTFEKNVIVAAGARPPADVDVARLIRVYVNAGGEAEWSISGGANPRSVVIPRRERK